MSRATLTIEGALAYLAASQVSLAFGGLSWNQYLLRLQFLKSSVDPGSLEARIFNDMLSQAEFEDEDDWLDQDDDEPKELSEEPGTITPTSVDANRDPARDDLIVLKFVPSAGSGLHDWKFDSSDPDFFPSVPHGHWKSRHRRRLDAYRGWVYESDRQVDREPRRKLVALWNDDRFRTFAAATIHHYIAASPNFRWRVPNPRRLPRKR